MCSVAVLQAVLSKGAILGWMLLSALLGRPRSVLHAVRMHAVQLVCAQHLAAPAGLHGHSWGRGGCPWAAAWTLLSPWAALQVLLQAGRAPRGGSRRGLL